MNGYFNYKDELYHYGVLGMKWGVRRYQDYGKGGYNPKKVAKKLKKAEKKRRWKIANDAGSYTTDLNKMTKYSESEDGYKKAQRLKKANDDYETISSPSNAIKLASAKEEWGRGYANYVAKEMIKKYGEKDFKEIIYPDYGPASDRIFRKVTSPIDRIFGGEDSVKDASALKGEDLVKAFEDEWWWNTSLSNVNPAPVPMFVVI